MLYEELLREATLHANYYSYTYKFFLLFSRVVEWIKLVQWIKILMETDTSLEKKVRSKTRFWTYISIHNGKLIPQH